MMDKIEAGKKLGEILMKAMILHTEIAERTGKLTELKEQADELAKILDPNFDPDKKD